MIRIKKNHVTRIFVLLLVISIMLSGCSGGTDTNDKPAPTNTQSSSTNTEPSKTEDSLPEVTLKLANVVAVGTAEDLQSNMFKDIVAEKTNGKLKIEVYSGGTLGGSKDTIEGLKYGIADIVIDSFAYLADYSTAKWSAFETACYVYNDYDHYKKIWSPGGYGDTLLKKLEDETSFIVLSGAMDGSRHITSKKAIETPDDLTGVKMRVPNTPINIAAWTALGANTTPMDFSEVYTALQQNMIEAQENPLSTSFNASFYEVCPYLTLSAHSILTDGLIMDKEKFYSLPEEYQIVLKEAAIETSAWRTDNTLKLESDLVEEFKKHNVTVIKPEVKPWQDKIASFHSTLEQQVQDVINEIKAN